MDCAFTKDVPLHREPARYRVSLPEGCICYPDAREQWLCEHHYLRMEGNGVKHEVLEDLG